MKYMTLSIKGKVQGVWFRDYTQKLAMSFDINGWVKNMDDGSVYVVASGSDKNALNFKNQLQIGSPLSRVDSVEELGDIDLKPMESFEIKYT